MIGQTVSQFKILDRLGAGGMGEVFLAEDTRLERKVALKFLHDDMSSRGGSRTTPTAGYERFKREARAAAKLNHPNIVTIFEIGEHNGDTYIAMEYVDGHTLRDKIVGAPPRGRPKTGQAQGPAPTEKLLSFDEITDIATQICEGLSEAHKAGISHRDIKPENIIIDKSGRAKLLDFGLAQMQDVSRLTRETSTVGTAKYMSPEQYKSEDLDHRTDIWSFGVVLFEMLTGKIPFQGEYEAAVMYSVVNTEPESTRSIRPDIPKYFDVIISKCLEKNPADRFQSMLELSGELTLPSSVARIDPEPETEIERSIVVLPFENMSSDPEQEYFSDGLTEEIITDLSHIHDLRVISRNSAMMLKGSRKETKTIARELNVQYVLEGSVRKAGNNLRITAQLINAPVDDHVWAEKYDGTLDDIFDIQEKVSRSIVDALKVKLTQKESKQVANRPVDNIHAYDYYLKARHEMWKWTENSQKLAIKYLEESLKIVGNNALLYGSLGNAYWNLADISDNPEEYLKKAEDYAHKANDLESNHYLSFLVLGLVSATLGDGKQYVKNLEKSLELYSESPDGLFFLSFAYIGYLGKTEDAEVLVKKLLDIDPLNPTYNFLPGYIQFFNGQFDLAEKNLEKTYNTDPENSYVKMGYILALTYNQQYEKAFNISSFSIKTSPENKISQFCHCLTLALRGEKENARVILNKIKSRSFLDGWDTWFIAMCDALINEKEDALDGLEKAVDRGFINYPFLNEYDPFLENIRNEPRFKKLMKRVKHEWENFDSENPQPYIEEEETELPETQEKSIIVLPFDDMSPDKDNEYFSDGLTEEIITDLSHIHDLLVISRSSAMTFKGKDQTIPEIVKKVNVRYVLEGSVRKAGNNLRITAQLIDATTDVHLWAEKYDGTLDDIFDIQEKVSRAIVDALKVRLTLKESKQIADRPIENVQAYECYLKAKKEVLTFTKDGLDRAIQHLQNGLSIIGENSLFYAGMSYAYMQHVNLGADPDEYLLRMQQYSEKAFELDPDSPHTLFGLGLVDLFNRKIKMAGSRFKRVLDIDHSNYDALFWSTGVYGGWLGQPEAGHEFSRRLKEIDPLNPTSYIMEGWIFAYEGKFKKALVHSKKAYEMNINPAPVYKFHYSRYLAYNNKIGEALSILTDIDVETCNDSWDFLSLFMKYALNDDKNIIEKLRKLRYFDTIKWNFEWSHYVAAFFALLEEKDDAMNWLENAVDRGFINYPFLNEYDPFLENIRGEERFKKLMERVKHEWENFEV